MASEATGVAALAGRYASALFDIAEQQKQLDVVAADLTNLREAIASSPDFKRLIRSPVISSAQQGKAIAAVVDKLELSPLSKNFIGLVIRNRRAFALPAMADGYLELLAERRGEVRAEVTSAQELTPAQLQAVTEQLRRSVGSKVAVKTGIDPQILGGLIVKVGSRLVDGSLRTKLHKLQLAMKGI